VMSVVAVSTGCEVQASETATSGSSTASVTLTLGSVSAVVSSTTLRRHRGIMFETGVVSDIAAHLIRSFCRCIVIASLAL